MTRRRFGGGPLPRARGPGTHRRVEAAPRGDRSSKSQPKRPGNVGAREVGRLRPAPVPAVVRDLAAQQLAEARQGRPPRGDADGALVLQGLPERERRLRAREADRERVVRRGPRRVPAAAAAARSRALGSPRETPTFAPAMLLSVHLPHAPLHRRHERVAARLGDPPLVPAAARGVEQPVRRGGRRGRRRRDDLLDDDSRRAEADGVRPPRDIRPVGPLLLHVLIARPHGYRCRPYNMDFMYLSVHENSHH